MTVKNLREFIFENYCKQMGVTIKDLVLLAINLTKN